MKKKSSPNRQNVKSEEISTADGHEREKNFLSIDELNLILDGAKKSRNPIRDHLIILMMFRHGLRVSEAISLKLSHIELNRSRIWVHRLKNSLSVEQPIAGDVLRAIKRYLKQRNSSLPWLFISERNTPITRQNINYITHTAGMASGLGHVNPHMLRHSCGYFLANKGHDLRLIQDYLGHRDPKHTVKYTRTASHRFEGLWES